MKCWQQQLPDGALWRTGGQGGVGWLERPGHLPCFSMLVWVLRHFADRTLKYVCKHQGENLSYCWCLEDAAEVKQYWEINPAFRQTEGHLEAAKQSYMGKIIQSRCKMQWAGGRTTKEKGNVDSGRKEESVEPSCWICWLKWKGDDDTKTGL